jgi:hypothetical protein
VSPTLAAIILVIAALFFHQAIRSLCERKIQHRQSALERLGNIRAQREAAGEVNGSSTKSDLTRYFVPTGLRLENARQQIRSRSKCLRPES